MFDSGVVMREEFGYKSLLGLTRGLNISPS